MKLFYYEGRTCFVPESQEELDLCYRAIAPATREQKLAVIRKVGRERIKNPVMRICSLCREPGHRKDGCPQSPGFVAPLTDEQEADVFALKEEGRTSVEVANFLKLPIKSVNAVWGKTESVLVRSESKKPKGAFIE